MLLLSSNEGHVTVLSAGHGDGDMSYFGKIITDLVCLDLDDNRKQQGAWDNKICFGRQRIRLRRAH